MKRGLYQLMLPFLWLTQLSNLGMMIIVHVGVAPIRAFIYWGRLLQDYPGWGSGPGDAEFGISVAPRGKG